MENSGGCDKKNNQNPLDYPVTEQELIEVIQSLKGKKACGVDGILNEMIKYSDHNIRLAILKLFNTILSTATFPDIWNKGLITPIHKPGDNMTQITTEEYAYPVTWEKYSATS